MPRSSDHARRAPYQGLIDGGVQSAHSVDVAVPDDIRFATVRRLVVFAVSTTRLVKCSERTTRSRELDWLLYEH